MRPTGYPRFAAIGQQVAVGLGRLRQPFRGHHRTRQASLPLYTPPGTLPRSVRPPLLASHDRVPFDRALPAGLPPRPFPGRRLADQELGALLAHELGVALGSSSAPWAVSNGRGAGSCLDYNI